MHTRRWATTPATDPLDFVYTLRSAAETWLIGGQRRAHFTLSPSTPSKTFSIILIPLKPGAHLLPTIDISAVAPTDGPTAERRSSGVWQAKRPDAEVLGAKTAGAGVGGLGEGLVSCETDYTSSGTVVLVTRDARVTGVTVAEGGGVGAGAGAGGLYVDGAAAGRASEDMRLSRALS